MGELNVIRIKREEGEDVHYPAMYESVPEHYKLYAEKALNETDESRIEGLQRLRECIKKRNLTCPEDNYLLSILRCNKFDFARVEHRLEKSVRAYEQVVDRVSRIDRAKVEAWIDDLSCSILPYRDKSGRLIVFLRQTVNLDNYNPEEGIYCGLAMLLFFLCSPLTSICGFVMVGDTSNATLYLAYQFIRSVKAIVSTLVHLSFRLGRADVLNDNFLAHWGLKIMGPFFPEKLLRRFSLHEMDMKNIHDLYDPEILPCELEGKLGPLTNKHYREEFLTYIERLKEGAR